MTTITKERAEIKSFITGFLSDPAHDNQSSDSLLANVFRIALASLEAEPVAWMRDDADGREYNARNEFSGGGGGIPLYATPQVQVVPEEMYWQDAPVEGSSKAAAYATGWNACRAAMLHGAEPVSQTYKLPVNTPCQDAPAHIWLQTAGVWPEDGELSELTWCSHNQHHDDTLYVRADLVNGNYPVTPDGWISCSERMPDDGQHVIILCDSAFVLYAQYRDGEFFDVVRNGEEFFETQSRNVTHWMPLPEPPQEVK
ncbi:TPA: DUF551 domain-containing protein [Escherichia coli]|uniref:DUF551 domain-containing protein n=1 Tax=Escherichia coli TaxID=562 RepID=UPI00098B2ECB|nr:DUF551 domain-containing protein [Escherichia coli]MBA1800987.1 DUF551 domain-containing protein [Escherichia coli]MDW9347267.1 DUF551 domain-containing protein [Escherichia coli]MED7731492.1 DUF551 domain-containing protein [Escherichia coli]QRU64601.1 DUF551 domain-containing protein [Escherichia coli]RWV39561.1 DUF551 domain-containing protein [Escherichia coli]